ncbi:MAG: GNAT family N-acetyltransferase [Propionicimonas sp.]|nr:GNAT family N-acetyltransferase [Propionicimonas sp.]
MKLTPAALPDTLRHVDVPEDRLDDILDLDLWAFPASHTVGELRERPSPLSWDRVRGVEAEGVDGLVGMHASYPFARFPVPGATLAVAGLTWVGVHPGHRRQGILRAMVNDHLAAAAGRGETVSALTASEPAIYGRFGYGMASQVVSLSLPRGATLHPVPGSDRVKIGFEAFDLERHRDLVAELHAAAGGSQPNRPGWVTRETPELARGFLDDHPIVRGGSEPRRMLVARVAGRPTGYAMFRRRLDWPDGTAAGTVHVRETVALDPPTAHALWSRLLDLDLTTSIEVGQLTLADPLLGLLVDLRAAKPRLSDNVWIRIIDLPGALAGRRYASDLDLVLEVGDDLIAENAGRWRVRAAAFAGDVSVTRTDDAADIRLDVATLGALYLGGGSAASLAGAGALTASSPAALARFATAFGWPVPPGSSWVF